MKNWVLIIIALVLSVVFVYALRPDLFSNRRGLISIEEIIKNPENFYGRNVSVEGFLGNPIYEYATECQCSFYDITDITVTYVLNLHNKICYRICLDAHLNCGSGSYALYEFDGMITNEGNLPSLIVSNQKFVDCIKMF